MRTTDEFAYMAQGWMGLIIIVAILAMALLWFSRGKKRNIGGLWRCLKHCRRSWQHRITAIYLSTGNDALQTLERLGVIR